MNKKDTHVVVGLSGGVDSAVSAYLLKAEGYTVTGVFMQNWESEEGDPHCTAEQDLSDARAAADKLGIPLRTVNFAKDYWQNVFEHCLNEYKQGRTPNPDVLCNREIKFKVFLEHALSLGADRIATGHYCRTQQHAVTGAFELLKGLDPEKDQSYFLYMLNQVALSKSVFPLGGLHKAEVRQIAERIGLPNHAKKDSTGICFIGEREFKSFLQEFILAQPGEIVDEAGHHMGQHDGVMFYTLGQRKGLHIGGQKTGSGQAWYLIEKDIANNRLVVGQGYDHPALYRNELTCESLTWLAEQPPSYPLRCMAKTRYHQTAQACTVTPVNEGSLKVTFDEPQRAITPGQSVVLYCDAVCLGGGIIC